MIRVILGFLLIVFFLAGCASDTASIKYYKLGVVKNNSAEEHSTPILEEKNPSKRPLILIEPIVLPDFLRQQGLVIQKTDHQLQVSNVHRWAENLESASSRVIQSHLENLLPEYRFENKSGRWKATPKFRLSIELTEFQVKNRENTVISSGRFWIFDEDGSLLTKESFLLEEPLSRNGYEHAIFQLGVTLERLAGLIGDGLSF